ncbi:cell division protein FtsZ [Polymorphobacter multimanifer]|uniref:Cell division protein FtsZ n=1 Tax=Polymorphobacter multimanifer TaxID=1070431 RepID=A0A841L4M0_9SPHN|nr:cell division protein FtsZ [Polymorphobacter multimanifer]MBB6227597.1 cell division protein FtsZ [Polymorphobacter multimanifer]
MLEFERTELTELKPRITVVGVGGAGCNAVANMINADLQGVDFIVANTDAQSLAASKAETRIQLGMKITQGLGAGARPEIGRAAAEETLEQLENSLEGAHMCFIAAGMGGGTGTGAAPVVARAAREKGILTVGVVTKPFTFEGSRRMRAAEEGIAELQKVVDTLIVIPNQNLFLIANQSTSLVDAFAMADQVLHQGVRGITDLMILPGLINLDFADIRTVMSEMGKAMMGTGEASGEGRALSAAEKAIANPLLDEVSMRGAKGVIINITGGTDLTLMEVDEAATYIRDLVDPEANIIVGSALNRDLEGTMRVSVVATGIDAAAKPEPVRSGSRDPARHKPEPAVSTQPSIFASAPSIVPTASTPKPASADTPVAPEPVAEAPAEEDEIDLGAMAERIEPEAPMASGESFRFTPANAPVGPAGPAQAPPAPAAKATPAPAPPAPTPVVVEPVAAERAPTLFEKMLGLSGGHRPKPVPPPANLAPEPEAREPEVEIPPFFKRQINN